MKKHFIRTIATLLVVVLTLTATPLNGFVGLSFLKSDFHFSAEATTSDDYLYSVINGSATITGVNELLIGSITIPECIDGYPVTRIGDGAFSGCTKITSVTFPDSVEIINSNAFKNYMPPIQISYSIMSINTQSSSACSSLGEIIIKNANCIIFGDYETIDPTVVICGHDNSTAQAYAEKYNRTFVSIDGEDNDIIATGHCGDYADWTLSRSGKLSITSTGAMYDYNLASDVPWYKYRGFIKSVSIDDGITSIGENSFYFCVNLHSVTMPANIINIGNSAFYNCSSLTSVILGNCVTNINDSAFYGCTSLNTIVILNQNCSIHDANSTIPTQATIVGYDNSTARSYARKYNRTFELIDCGHMDENTDGLCDLCKTEFKPTLHLGDINNDGSVTSSDARTALRAAVGLDELTETQTKAADVDKDGKITSSDARSILRCAVGLETF